MGGKGVVMLSQEGARCGQDWAGRRGMGWLVWSYRSVGRMRQGAF
jgi:hypothetical protein